MDHVTRMRAPDEIIMNDDDLICACALQVLNSYSYTNLEQITAVAQVSCCN